MWIQNLRCGFFVVSPECIHVFQSEKLMHNTTIPHAGDKQAGTCGTGQKVRSKQVDWAEIFLQPIWNETIKYKKYISKDAYIWSQCVSENARVNFNTRPFWQELDYTCADITRHYKYPPVDQIALLFKPHKMRNKWFLPVYKTNKASVDER